VRAAATDDAAARLRAVLAQTDDQLKGLRRQHDEIVAASRDSNADDEHDPEGSTIAFERQQVTALIRGLQATRADAERALTAVDAGTYGRCERCGQPIGAARLQARPTARTCITCAARRT
jgi:DnaK suppressor protein